MTTPPAVPPHLLDRPLAGGLVVPWITPVTNAGVSLFGNIAEANQHRCLRERRCQICGRHLPDTAVLFARRSDLLLQCTSEPATCPPCAVYSARACPMLSGARTTYRSGTHPALADAPADPQRRLRQSAAAERWFAVHVQQYTVIRHPEVPDTLAASWRRIPPLRIDPALAIGGPAA
ncbi:hypothetical protein Daura_23100 [Dactylosporangium aurantiacum]|uniref:Uncharacterized protein n=1 Tax=Dactylosporangium aurantiacum TaxID=35754 RepID=A0A9Q9IMC5_9ACTN|nr:hypothetical protein [Dactylosporangium aurantiacum]MDG6104026.1 hypothetical protein [Dactylosporangium aurantiacum]UWZ58799.1 hypothetical protein Daura_23100 [Dactylosporangium aurantiacum]